MHARWSTRPHEMPILHVQTTKRSMNPAMTQAATGQRITRAQILHLGRTQKGWAFLPLAAQALRVAPDDDEVRLLAAQTLRTLGLAALSRLVAQRIRPGPLGDQRDRLLATLDRQGMMDLDVLIARARANLDHLPGVDTAAAIDAWVAQGTDYYQARDGNVVRVPRDGHDLPQWEWLGDVRSAAVEFCRAHLAGAASQPIGPITIEGVSPPWLLLAIHQATPALSDGYRPLLQIVQRDAAEFAEGMALADVREVFSRSVVFAGPEALARFTEHVRARFDYQAVGPVIPASTLRRQVEPALLSTVRALADEQRAESVQLRGKLLDRDRTRNSAWWKARYAEKRPRRVLIPTCRFSTYIRHASEDLAEAFREQGWEARVLIEPDDHTRFSTLAYDRAQLEFDPDLIVLINYPRASRAEAFAAQTPFVCWVQDAMPHLFDERVGRAHGARDFIVGHVYPKLFREFGYPVARAMSVPVVASQRKFHAGAANPQLLSRFACEVAYVSHHSETPTQMHERLCREVGDPHIVRVLEEMRALIHERYAMIQTGIPHGAAKSIPDDAWARACGHAPTPRVLAQLREQYLIPMLERMLRHEMLEWAADVCERRGWQLRIFGRGWESHERFKDHAGGELEHGEQLRAAYQAARVHLHASMCTLVHQRVMECALSGGLPLCRLVQPNLGASRQRAIAELVCTAEPDRVQFDGTLVFRTDAHEPLRRLRTTFARAGFELPDEFAVRPRTAENMKRFRVAFDGETAEGLLGDPAEAMFRDQLSMERLIERAVSDDVWRNARTQQIADHVRTHLTHDALVKRLVTLVEAHL